MALGGGVFGQCRLHTRIHTPVHNMNIHVGTRTTVNKNTGSNSASNFDNKNIVPVEASSDKFDHNAARS